MERSSLEKAGERAILTVGRQARSNLGLVLVLSIVGGVPVQPAYGGEPPCLAADITSIVISNGEIYITYSGVSNQTYVVQTSTNLEDWVDLVTNSAVGNLFSFIDLGDTNSNRRFYRALFNLNPADVTEPDWAGGGVAAASGVRSSSLTLSWGGATDDNESAPSAMAGMRTSTAGWKRSPTATSCVIRGTGAPTCTSGSRAGPSSRRSVTTPGW
jgi:hypothetical protein